MERGEGLQPGVPAPGGVDPAAGDRAPPEDTGEDQGRPAYPGVPKGGSFTRFAEFTRCERKAAYDCLINTFKETLPIRVGKQVHDAIEAILKGRPLQKVIEAGPLTEDDLRSQYLDQVQPVLDVLEPVTVEKFYKDMNGLPFNSRIDVVSRTLPLFDANNNFLGTAERHPCVVDWKTSFNPQRMFDKLKKLSRSMQLRSYCIITGEDTAGLIYMLPGAPVRGGFRTYTKKDLHVAEVWNNSIMDLWNARWRDAWDSPLDEIDGFDMSVFGMAAGEDPLCSPRWCPHWDRCLGRKD